MTKVNNRIGHITIESGKLTANQSNTISLPAGAVATAPAGDSPPLLQARSEEEASRTRFENQMSMSGNDARASC